MFNLKILSHLIDINSKLIESTAISDCHCIGLNSFIINEQPRMRLFIAENNCELYNKYDYLSPVIPIHPHKYDDVFFQIEGVLVHHLYSLGGSLEFNKYTYKRISDDFDIQLIGREGLNYHGRMYGDNLMLMASELHSASLEGERCSWVIVETKEDVNFNQVSYHQNLIKRSELYNSIDKPIEYLKNYFDF